MSRGDIRIGTSGWSYKHWKGPFYPAELSNDELLEYYAQHFSTVEINNTFYHLTGTSTLEAWRDAVPAGFVFTVKASRYVTHMKKLKDPEESIARFLERISVLGDKLGPVLFQLPPKWRSNEERLASFLSSLDDRFQYAFEFRDRSWLNADIYALLAGHNAALCLYDLDGYTSPKERTADFVYARLHGPAGPYQGSYSTQSLSGWAGAFSSWTEQGDSVYCYFDNDEAGYAAENAGRLDGMLED